MAKGKATPVSTIRAKKGAARVLGKFRGYYLDDIDCKYCPRFRGKVQGCPLAVCEFERERQEAIDHGRVKRPYTRISDW